MVEFKKSPEKVAFVGHNLYDFARELKCEIFDKGKERSKMWLVMWLAGVISGIAGVKIYGLLKEGKLQCRWYHWIIGALWYLLGIFIVGFVGTSFAEGESRAAGMAVLIFGGFFLVVSILLYRFVFSERFRGISSGGKVTA